MKRTAAILIVIMMLSGMVCTVYAEKQRKDLADNIEEYSCMILESLQEIYEVFGDQMEDTDVRMAYTYLMLFRGAMFVSLYESEDTLKSLMPGSFEDQRKLGGVDDVSISYTDEIVMVAENAWNAFQRGEMTRSEMLNALMGSIKSAVNIYRRGQEIYKENKEKIGE